MSRLVPLLGLGLALPVVAHAACTTQAKGTATGHFYVQNGQIIGPDGTPFLARGVNDRDIATDGQRLIDTFPGLNMVRVPIGPGSDPASFAAAVDLLSSQGIVVEFEDHSSSDGQNRGGGTGTIFTGQQLQDEMAMYSSFAGYYKFNPLVWFGTDNEPSILNPATGQSDPAALSCRARVSWGRAGSSRRHQRAEGHECCPACQGAVGQSMPEVGSRQGGHAP